jgi:hypothetical protein
MPAFIERADYLIRFGPETHRHGDPYEGTVSVLRLSDHEAELVGFAPAGHRMPERAKQYHRDVLACLRAEGFTTAIVTRIRRDGSTVVKRFDLMRRNAKESEAY